jgi:hypothetical protein
MKVKARFPIKIGDVLVTPGTVGEVVKPTPRILAAFPGLSEKPDGAFLLVKFPGFDECLVMPKQVVKLEESGNDHEVNKSGNGARPSA